MATRAIAMTVLLLGLSQAATGDVVGGEPPRLNNNPFTRPAPGIAVAESSANADSRHSTQPLDLRATLVSDSVRFANIAGKILAIGDKVQGYRLIAVRENKATFSKDGERITVAVRPDDTENIQ